MSSVGVIKVWKKHGQTFSVSGNIVGGYPCYQNAVTRNPDQTHFPNLTVLYIRHGGQMLKLPQFTEEIGKTDLCKVCANQLSCLAGDLECRLTTDSLQKD